jgi:WD40 repeat protein
MRALSCVLLGLAVAGLPVCEASAAEADPTQLVPDLHVADLALCPGGRSLAVRAGSNSYLVDWPAGTARAWTSPEGPMKVLPPCAAPSLGFSSDGRWFASASDQGDILILDSGTGAIHRTLSGHLGTIGAVAFSPDGRWLVSVGFDNDLRIWDASAGVCVKTITSLTHAAFSVAWAPDSRTFYTAGASRTVSAWNAATGERLRESPSQGRPIGALAVSTDGRRLAAGTFAAEGTGLPADIRLLDTDSFAEQRVIQSPDGGAVALAFSPDSRQLLWAAQNGAGIAVSLLEH